MENKIKKALVCGAGGFLGSHMAKRLKSEGYFVKGVDLKNTEFSETACDEFFIGDLRNVSTWEDLNCQDYDEIYQFAADMGGAGYIFTGEHDADVMSNSALINLNACNYACKWKIGTILYSSSACIYPAYNQEDPNNPKCNEDSVYPANPDSEYGWEKLFSERLYLSYHRNYNLNIRIVRFHNIFGPEGTWNNGKEKAPAALCRKVAEVKVGGKIEIWGDGKQTRSFLYIDECIEGVRRFINSDFIGPVNVGSDEMVTINKLAEIIMEVADKKVSIKHISGPLGVRGRNSDNNLIKEKLGWAPSKPLKDGLEKTYKWISGEILKNL